MEIQTKKRIQLHENSQTNGDCLICMEMSGNGVRTGMMKNIRQVLLLIRQVLVRARTGWFAAAAGAAAPSSAVRRTAAGAGPAAGSPASGSGSSSPQVSEQGKSASKVRSILNQDFQDVIGFSGYPVNPCESRF